MDCDDILRSHVNMAADIAARVKPLKYFDEYLRHGYYPYYLEQPSLYYSRMNEVVNFIIDVEIPHLRNIEVAGVTKMRQLLYVIAESAPFTPNVSKLGERIGISRTSLLLYMKALEESGLLIGLKKDAKGISSLQKPDKLYLDNPNLMYAIAPHEVNIGNARETFFANQLKAAHHVNVSPVSDFLIDNKYTFEIGGHAKGTRQIDGMDDAYIAADGIEVGYGRKIPLWLFGFLY